MNSYGLAEFSDDLCTILKSDGQAGLPRVAEKLELLLANPSFVAETFDDSTPPGKRVIFHDPETDAHVLAHVNEPTAQPGNPHSHGTSWAVYGNAMGSTGMTIWRRVNPETDAHAELAIVEKYALGAGQARTYPSGAIHSTEQLEKAWVIRITGTDLDLLPRYRFNRNTDRLLEVPMRP